MTATRDEAASGRASRAKDLIMIDWHRPSRRSFAANLRWLLPAFSSALLSWLLGGFTLQREP